MQVSFYLDKGNVDKQGLVSIFYSLTFKGSRIRKKVKGVKTKEKHWNSKYQRIRPNLKSEVDNYHLEYNEKIDKIDTNVKELYKHMMRYNIPPTKEFILDKLKNGLEAPNLSYEFFKSFDEFINSCKSTKAPRTITSYGTTLNFLKGFESYMEYELTFDSIDSTFFEKLQDYTFLIRENKNSYLAFITKTLKTFLTWAHEKEYHTNLKYKRFKAREDETEVIYLTIEELMTLFNHDFESTRLNHVRDVYCFNCFTGLRISDTRKLRASNILKDYLLLSIVKTRANNTKIPLNKFSKEILSRYTDTIYEPLPVISDQKFNKYIKECCQIVGIDSPITKTRYVGQRRITNTHPKHELITSHTARKTFVTNSLILGMNEIATKNMVGHKTGKSFKRYVNASDNLMRQEMDNTWDKL